MRPIRQTLNTVAPGPWIPLDSFQGGFGVALAVIPWSTATGLVYTVQHTFDSLDGGNLGGEGYRNVQVSRVAALATVFDDGLDGIGHGLSTGDSVLIQGSGSSQMDSQKAIPPLKGDLAFAVTVTDNTHYTYPVANAGPLADGGTTRALALRVFPHAVLAALSARSDGNYAFPPRACRLNVTALTGGAVDFEVIQGMIR